jgi:hypothetical protein
MTPFAFPLICPHAAGGLLLNIDSIPGTVNGLVEYPRSKPADVTRQYSTTCDVYDVGDVGDVGDMGDMGDMGAQGMQTESCAFRRHDTRTGCEGASHACAARVVVVVTDCRVILRTAAGGHRLSR